MAHVSAYDTCIHLKTKIEEGRRKRGKDGSMDGRDREKGKEMEGGNERTKQDG